MLNSLHIENIAVIRNLDINFENGFTVMTGETGAGKSIIIDSIGIVLGNKFPKDMIRTGQNQAMVCALFDSLNSKTVDALDSLGLSPDDDGNIYIQRTVTSDGRSSIKYNGRSIPLTMLKSAGNLLINIHGQFESQKLLDISTHIGYLDNFANDEHLLSEYTDYFNSMTEAEKSIESLSKSDREKQQRLDMLKFQIKDIEAAKIKPGEEEKIRSEKDILTNAKIISKQANVIYRALYKNDKGLSAYRMLEIARKAIEEIGEILPNASDYSDKLYDMQYEIESIADSVMNEIPKGADNPEQAILKIDDRLDVIHKIERKYGSSEEEVLTFLSNAKAELNEIMLSDEKIKEYTKIYDNFHSKALETAKNLSNVRKTSASILSDKICEVLQYLDLDKVKFTVNVKPRTEKDGSLIKTGADDVEFLVSTNPGDPLKSLSKIASGGELSRIMLAIKSVLSNADAVPTVIFDEIDTGVSGKTSQKIGIKLRDLSKAMQVICITHSAQVAANADIHKKIEKNEINGMSETSIRTLNFEERATELARIMGGVKPSSKIYDSAVEMLKNAEITN